MLCVCRTNVVTLYKIVQNSRHMLHVCSFAVTPASLTPIGCKAIDEWVGVDCYMQIFAYACWLLGDCNCQCAEISLGEEQIFFSSDLTLLFLLRNLLQREEVSKERNYRVVTELCQNHVQGIQGDSGGNVRILECDRVGHVNTGIILNGYPIDLFASTNAKSL